EEQVGSVQLPDPGQDRLEEGPADPAGAACQQEVDADVSGLGQQLHQGSERIAGRADHEVVVVDQDVDLGAAPPAAGPELGRGQVGAGEPGDEVVAEPADLGAGRDRRAGVAPQVGG